MKKISKRMSYVLRHHPDKIGVHLDPYGRVNVNLFIKKFNNHYGHPIDIPIIQKIIRNGDKKRFAIENGQIRALYGHSIPVKLLTTNKMPPDILYHGTTHSATKLILVEGIKKMDRDFAHLSTTTKMAHQVGARRDPNPIILIVHAKLAAHDGLSFYPTKSGIWLVDYVPVKYLEIMK